MKNFNLKKLVTSMTFLALVCAVPAQAAANRLSDGSKAIGLILGNPSGVTGKMWLEDSHAVDMGLSFSSDSFILVYADYLLHFPGLFGSSSTFTENLKPYLGLGAELSFARDSNRIGSRYLTAGGSSMGIGVRIPIGAEWMVPDAPFGIFLEIAPVFGIAPTSYSVVESGVGVRWYF
ncbi:MAG: hypothetical protein ABIQ95_03540 [Bdellovibrionia bacterium]